MIRSFARRARQGAVARWRDWRERVRGASSADPSVAFFQGIRRRLALWYCGVLAAILIVTGLVLYVGMRRALFDPVDQANTRAAGLLEQAWTTTRVPPCLEDFNRQVRVLALYACYDANGALVGANRLADEFNAFLTSDLAQEALGSGSGSDMIDPGNGFGAISRYAVVVRDPQSHQVLGVVQVGLPAQGELRALDVLLSLMIVAGIVTLLGAGLGGLWLSHRALEPARSAATRQQRFVADVSHELRTPLTLLRADSEVLLRDRAQFPAHDAVLLDDIVAETEHLAHVASRLLTLARLEANAVRLSRETIDVSALASQVVERMRPLAYSHDLSLALRDGPRIEAIGDGGRVIDALLILVENALTYHRPGGAVELAVSAKLGRAVVEVIDDGPGIAPEHLARLGERFYRPDAARSSETGGVGLGIAIAKEIAHALGGSLSFTSDFGVGTTATLSLPLVPESAGNPET